MNMRRSFPFHNKIEMLLFLKDKLKMSKILDLFSFSVRDYKDNLENILTNISLVFDGEIIIRSAASTEDQHSTNAGHFVSVQHVDSQDMSSVKKGINKVILSYENDSLPDSELIFIQKQLTDVFMAGVAFSFVPNNRKPYFFINYDDSGSTDSVTSGKSKKYMYIARDFVDSYCWESKLCSALLEIENHCGKNNLDIEFAVTKTGTIYIFQVRCLITISLGSDGKESIYRKNELSLRFKTINDLLSDMAFWNPSEIIGEFPHPLDYSLYNYLVTEHAWNEGISDIGYRSTTEKLMVKFGNKPYIKLKTVFQALTPASIGYELREKLLEYYCHVILNNKNLHDKIEFEVVYNCYNFSTKKKLNDLRNYGFVDKDILQISDALYQNTKSIIEQYDAILSKDLQCLIILERTYDKCKMKYCLDKVDDILDAIVEIMPIIRDYGVVPFARQARCAFIARSLCLSMLDEGLVDADTMDLFMRSIKTVTSELQEDVIGYHNGKVDMEYIQNKYGHLRSHSYDITSPTYNQIGFSEVFNCFNNKNSSKVCETQINTCFPETDINLTKFIKTSFAQREYFKFIFTKSLSFVLDLISNLAKHLGMSKEEISYSTIEQILELPFGHGIKKSLVEEIEKNMQDYEINSLIILPPIIVKPKDFNVIKINESTPNYITNHIAEGEILLIDSLPCDGLDVSGKIVAIQYADPGYDWIFAAGSITGLITQYGGMASHMAIRCMEFDIPAAIGCGEIIFNQVIHSQRVILDCSAKKVVSVQ